MEAFLCREDDTTSSSLVGKICVTEESGRKVKYVLPVADFLHFCERHGDEVRRCCLPRPGVIRLFLPEPSRLPPLLHTFTWKDYPETTQRCVREYQAMAVDKIIHERNGQAMLISEPGSGKTLIVAVCLQYYLKQSRTALFIVPNETLAVNTRNELAKWTHIPGSEVEVMVSATAPVTKRVVVCTYKCATTNPAIRNHRWDNVVCDESQFLKNPRSKRSAAITPLLCRPGTKLKLLFTGTPRLKCNSELYCQLLPFLGEPVLGKYEDFCFRYCDAEYQDKYRARVLVMRAQRYMEELHALVDRVSVRVDADLQLQPFTRRFVELENVPDNPALAENLRRIESPLTPPEERDLLVMESWRMAGRDKFQAALAWIKGWIADHPPHEKLAVFLHHRHLVESYVEALKEHGGVRVIHGKTSTKQRVRIIQELSAPRDNGVRVALLTFETCSLGITLCPGVVDCAFAEIFHTPTTMIQCERKVHRLTATSPCTSFWLVAHNTYDDRMVSMNQRKTCGNSAAIEGKRQRLLFD